MVCAFCGARNEEAAKFCLQCGVPVHRDQKMTLAQVEEKVEALVKEALELFEQKRYPEAMLAIEGILALDPENATAYSLRGLIHEKRGAREDAIASFERVVALNPFSIADRAKLEALKSGEPSDISKTVMPRERSIWEEMAPIAFAALAGVLVLGFGIWFASIKLSATTVAKPDNAMPTSITEHRDDGRQAIPETRTPPETGTVRATTIPPADSSSSDERLMPMSIDPSRLSLSGPSSRPSEPAAPSPAPPTEPAPRDDASLIMPDVGAKESSKAVYDIRVSRPDPNAPPRTTEGADALIRLAQDHQRAQDYRKAIDLYQQALPTTKNVGETHQQIALCYQRLGDRARAREHYRSAIAAYDAQIREGRDVALARRGADTSRIALSILEE